MAILVAVHCACLSAYLATVAAAPTSHLRSQWRASSIPRGTPRSLEEVHEEVSYRWMWADAGDELLGHDLAEIDPFRWSAWMSAGDLASNLEHVHGSDRERPVELATQGAELNTTRFQSVHEAIQYLHQEKEVQARASDEKQFRWMWGDAGNNSWGHELAELDPFRWSLWLGPEAAVEDLKAYKSMENDARPVEVMIGQEGGQRKLFTSIDEAIHFISQHPTVQDRPGSVQDMGGSNAPFERSSSILIFGVAATGILIAVGVVCFFISRKLTAKDIEALSYDNRADMRALCGPAGSTTSIQVQQALRPAALE